MKQICSEGTTKTFNYKQTQLTGFGVRRTARQFAKDLKVNSTSYNFFLSLEFISIMDFTTKTQPFTFLPIFIFVWMFLNFALQL